MHTVTLEMDDKEYNHLINIYSKQHSVKIINDVENDDDFKIDVDYCIEVSEKIKTGDRSGFKTGTAQDLFDELGI